MERIEAKTYQSRLPKEYDDILNLLCVLYAGKIERGREQRKLLSATFVWDLSIQRHMVCPFILTLVALHPLLCTTHKSPRRNETKRTASKMKHIYHFETVEIVPL